MSLIIAISVPEGIVISGDSRMIVTMSKDEADPKEPDKIIKTKIPIIISDYADKIFCLYERFGIGTFGESMINGLPISHHIKEFEYKYNTDPPKTTEALSDCLRKYFRTLSQPKKILSFLVAGYDNNIPFLYGIELAKNETARQNISPDESLIYCIGRGGEPDIVDRLLSQPQFIPSFAYMNLQDAVDYSRHLIRLTIDQMRFESRVATIGGDIDTLLVTTDGAKFLLKKEIKCS